MLARGNSLTKDTGIKTPFFLPQSMCQSRRVALIWLLFKPFWNLAFCNQFKFRGGGDPSSVTNGRLSSILSFIVGKKACRLKPMVCDDGDHQESNLCTNHSRDLDSSSEWNDIHVLLLREDHPY